MSDHQSPFVPANYSSDSEKSSNSSDPVVEARKQEAIECLKQVLEPILNKDIVSLGMVRIFQVVDNLRLLPPLYRSASTVSSRTCSRRHSLL